MNSVQRYSRTFICLALTTLLFTLTAAAEDSSEQWQLIGDDDGIRSYRREIPGSKYVAMRGEMTLRATIPQIISVLRDSPRKKHWVSRVVEAYSIQKFGDWESLEYNHSRGLPPLVSDRDFVFRAHLSVDPVARQATLKLKSERRADFPEREGIVRGEMLQSMYRLTEVGNELEGGAETRVEVEVHADPKGAVPGWIINLFQKSWPRNTLKGIEQESKRPDLVPDHATTQALLRKKTR